MTVLLDISYIGTAYAGWQVQPNAPTVQAAMCDAVERLLGVRCPVTGCSRTDSGVHAHSFCCTVSELPEGFSIPTDRIPLALSLAWQRQTAAMRPGWPSRCGQGLSQTG